MARFDKLEFNAGNRPSPEPSERDPLSRDAGYWMNKADESRRTGLYEAALQVLFPRAGVGPLAGRRLGRPGADAGAVAGIARGRPLEPQGAGTVSQQWRIAGGPRKAFCRMGDSKQAHALCDGSLQQAGQSAYRWLVRGEIMVAARQDMDRYCFDKAQELDADWLVALEAARIELYYRRPSRALGRARRALETAPEAHYVWYVQGICQSELGLTRAARESFQRCLELFPRHADAQEQLHRLQEWSWSPMKILRRLFGR